MKMRILIVLLWIIVGVVLWQKMRPEILKHGAVSHSTSSSRSPEMEVSTDISTAAKTKAADRPPDATRYTHSPERLQEFMLPAMVIDGLILDEAMKKLMAAYKDACRKSGEKPLPLTFVISPDAARRLTVHLPAGNFKASVQLLAALSGMKVSRKEFKYRFEPFPNERKAVNQTLRVTPDFSSTLMEMAGQKSHDLSSSVLATTQNNLEKLGLIDPSTRVSMTEFGELKLETMSTRDAAMVTELTKSYESQPPRQIKAETRILELSVGVDWTPPDVSEMTNGEAITLMRNLAQTKGTELMTLPSVTSRNAQNATIEMIREVIFPTDDSRSEFEKRDVGKILNVQGNLLGFGHEMDLKFTDTSLDFNSSTGNPIFKNRTEMAEKSYTSDGATKLVVQTRPDGSRTVLLFKAHTIDATGQPIR